MIVEHNRPKKTKPRRGSIIKNQKHYKICLVNTDISKVLLIINPSFIKRRIIG
jgi:hypothetical protein